VKQYLNNKWKIFFLYHQKSWEWDTVWWLVCRRIVLLHKRII